MAHKEELARLLNQALELEQAARIQYLCHAELVDGLNAEPIIARLKEIAGDEEKHEKMFRELLGSYLGATPSMKLAETHPAASIEDILKTNLADEKHAVDVYTGIHKRLTEMKDDFTYEYYQLEHTLRHVIGEEQEHISELKLLLGMK